MSDTIQAIQQVSRIANSFFEDLPELRLGFDEKVKALWSNALNESSFYRLINEDPPFQILLNQLAEEFIRLRPESRAVLQVSEVKRIFIATLIDKAEAFGDTMTLVA